VAVIGQLLVAGAVILTGLVGAEWHVGFPMWNRVSRASKPVLIIDDMGYERFFLSSM
jgi:glucose dehydrogenase